MANGQLNTIWPGDVRAQNVIKRHGYQFHSPRAGGDYILAVPAMIDLTPLDDQDRARLTTILVDRRSQGESAPSSGSRTFGMLGRKFHFFRMSAQSGSLKH